MRRIWALILTASLLLPATPPALAEPEEAGRVLYEAASTVLEQCVEADMTDLEKLTVLHDWMCLNCDYGVSPRSQTAYGAIVEGSAVCVGYAAGLAYLTDLAGLEGVYTYSAEIDHAWAIVTLDGSRYFSDCTWDDGKNAKLGLVRHDYFLFDESNAGITGHTGWDSDEAVPGGPLEGAPWVQAVTRVIFQGDWCWYIDGDFCLWRCDRDTWEAEPLLTVDETWPIWGVEGSGRDGVYSGLALIGDRLYFNTPYAICSAALDGGDMRTELTPDTSEGVLYGLDVRDGRLCYSIATEPDAVRYQVLDADFSAQEA